jgi:predicted HTH transcriptional regulator
MPDGSIVQNIDTDHVASKRRNPVIADVFGRMQLMERRGSGFRKIKAEYRQAAHDREELEPAFWSAPSSFFVVLYNLNHGVALTEKSREEENTALTQRKSGLEEENPALTQRKTDLEEGKPAFEILISAFHFNKQTKKHILTIYSQFGSEVPFSRADIMAHTGLSATAASDLLRKLKDAGLVERAEGRGKYKLIKPQE